MSVLCKIVGHRWRRVSSQTNNYSTTTIAGYRCRRCGRAAIRVYPEQYSYPRLPMPSRYAR